MNRLVSIAEYMARLGYSSQSLAEAARLDVKTVSAIVEGRYTSSPEQRQRLAQALGATVDEIDWSNSARVDHMYGHGPQFGRSP